MSAWGEEIERLAEDIADGRKPDFQLARHLHNLGYRKTTLQSILGEALDRFALEDMANSMKRLRNALAHIAANQTGDLSASSLAAKTLFENMPSTFEARLRGEA